MTNHNLPNINANDDTFWQNAIESGRDLARRGGKRILGALAIGALVVPVLAGCAGAKEGGNYEQPPASPDTTSSQQMDREIPVSEIPIAPPTKYEIKYDNDPSVLSRRIVNVLSSEIMAGTSDEKTLDIAAGGGYLDPNDPNSGIGLPEFAKIYSEKNIASFAQGIFGDDWQNPEYSEFLNHMADENRGILFAHAQTMDPNVYKAPYSQTVEYISNDEPVVNSDGTTTLRIQMSEVDNGADNLGVSGHDNHHEELTVTLSAPDEEGIVYMVDAPVSVAG